jgi:mediator of RNA polymerase II transcription subunit 10
MEPSPPHSAAGNGGLSVASLSAAASTESGSGSSDESKQNLAQVTESIQKSLGILHQLYLTVSSFNVSSQLPLLQRLYGSLYL